MSEGPIIGIRFGTGNVCVAVAKPNALPDVLADEGGDRQIPCHVVYQGEDVLVGVEAVGHAVRQPTAAVPHIKRVSGKGMDHEDVEDYRQVCHAKIVEIDGRIAFEIDGVVRSAEDVASALFGKLKATAEAFAGPVTKAVVSMPESLADEAKESIVKAAKQAGLDIVQFLHDPAAAVLAYGAENNWPVVNPSYKLETVSKPHKYLVFQMGSLATTSTIVEDIGGVLSVICAETEPVGGSHFDDALLQYCVKDFETKTKISLAGNTKALKRLRREVESSKANLARNQSSSVHVDALAEGIDFSLLLNRARLETQCASLFEQAISTVHRALESIEVAPENIDFVLVVGGPTRMVRMQQLLLEAFNGREPLKTVMDPDAVIAMGCAVQGALLQKLKQPSEFSSAPVAKRETMPHTLSIEGKDGQACPLLHKYHVLPAHAVLKVGVPASGAAALALYEGEGSAVAENRLVGRVQIPAGTKGPAEVAVEVDVAGTLTVTVTSAAGEKVASVTLAADPTPEEDA